MKKYKLTQPLPTFAAGETFYIGRGGHLYAENTQGFPEIIAYTKNTLDKFPEILNYWFKEIEEPRREIKFRIWDGDKNEWLGASDPNLVTFYGFHLIGEVMNVQAVPEWALGDNEVVEQYTGIKDKHGKEIYEGDIVRYDKGNTISPVVFEYGGFTLKNDLVTLGGAITVYKDVEVIGNIHENPELLKEE